MEGNDAHAYGPKIMRMWRDDFYCRGRAHMDRIASCGSEVESPQESIEFNTYAKIQPDESQEVSGFE